MGKILQARHGTGKDVLVEGPKSVRDLLAGGFVPSVVVVRGDSEGLWSDLPIANSVPVFRASGTLFDRIAATRTPQGVLALFTRPLPDPAVLRRGRFVLALAGVQDPGNVGALLRSAAAFGAAAAVVGGGSAHPFGARAIRASAGAVFRFPVFETEALVPFLIGRGFGLAVAEARGGRDPEAYSWRGRWALVLGNEGRGSGITGGRRLTLPLAKGIESLNVATAGAILLYTLSRAVGCGPFLPHARMGAPSSVLKRHRRGDEGDQ